jgi:hypothetical protein
MRKFLYLVVCIMLVGLTGCPPNTPTLPTTNTGTGGGWIIETSYSDNGLVSIAPVTSISGVWQADGNGAMGNPNPFSVATNSLGLAAINNGTGGPHLNSDGGWPIT